MTKDLDNRVSELIEEWEERTPSDQDSGVRRALSHIIINRLYKLIRKEILRENHIETQRLILLRFRDARRFIVHFLWYLPWTIKWFFVLPFMRDRRFILASFLPDRKTSFYFINELRQYAARNSSLIIHFSILYQFSFVFDAVTFCYPHFLFKCRFLEGTRRSDLDYSKIDNKIKGLLDKYFPGQRFPQIELRKHCKNLLFVQSSFKNLIDVLRTKGSVLFFIQDIDSLAERIIFIDICRSYKISTIGLDHAIILFKHLFKTSYSDYSLVWGTFQKEKIDQLSKIKPREVHVIGRPDLAFEFSDKLKKPKHWIYLMPAFQNPLVESFTRSLHRTLFFVGCIERLIGEKYPNISLLVKAHPSDDKRILPKGHQYFVGDIAEILSATQLVFVEDSTISIEMLRYKIPIIYVAGKEQSDNFKIEQWSSGLVLKDNTTLSEIVAQALVSDIDEDNRRKMFEYYCGNHATFSRDFQGFLKDKNFTRKRDEKEYV